MLSLFKTIQKKNNQEISIFSNAKSQSTFQGYSPFMMQSDLNKSLKQADKYGHKLNKKNLPNVADTTVAQSKMGLYNSAKSNSSSSPMIQAAFKFPRKKNIDKGSKTADYGANISNTLSETAAHLVKSDMAGGMGGALKVGAVASDARDTHNSIKEGNKVNASTSGTKFLAGGAESGANIAKFAGDAVDKVGVGVTGGVGSAVTGAVDAGKGAYNIKQSRKGYHNIKDVARNAAEKVEPSQPGSKPRRTKELAQVQKTIPQKIQDKQSEIGDTNTQIKDKRKQLRQATQQTDKDNLQQEIQGLKQRKGSLWRERNGLQKQGDILQVAQYAANTQSKTTKREGINTASGVGQTIGGSLAIAGTLAGGLGAVPGAATSMAAASIKPAAWLTRTGKQWGRDKGFPGFNQEKTSDKKNDERAEIADKLATRRKDPQMQTIFENLPGVSKNDMNSFKDNQMSQNQIMDILKRRQY